MDKSLIGNVDKKLTLKIVGTVTIVVSAMIVLLIAGIINMEILRYIGTFIGTFTLLGVVFLSFV